MTHYPNVRFIINGVTKRGDKGARNAASLLGRRSAALRAKKWGKEEFVRRMREWGKLGGRPKGSGEKKGGAK